MSTIKKELYNKLCPVCGTELLDSHFRGFKYCSKCDKRYRNKKLTQDEFMKLNQHLVSSRLVTEQELKDLYYTSIY